ncbi:hypothetical protein [Streptomyces sp. NPDC059224]|uniref:hypothetical protein n=1 Tax=Streptomyces sp. NPDC059224 TaxID=3346775 RepID=UPI0036B9964E
MTLEEVYGSKPDLLPRSMIRLVRAGQQGSRRTVWVGCEGVRLLDLSEHLLFERQSLGRFPRDSDGSIAWRDADDSLVVWSKEEDSIDLENAIRDFARGCSGLVIQWGSLAIPSVDVSQEAMVSHVAEIVDSMPEFWIYSSQDRLIMERSFSGLVTVARVPTEPSDPSLGGAV